MSSTVHPKRRFCAHLLWHHPLHIGRWQQQRSFTIPSVTKLPHSHSVLSLINQPSNVGIFLRPSEREFIIQLLTKSGTPRAVLATAGEVRHISVDLLAWYTGHSKIKYVPQDMSHLSSNCHKPIFTTRTSTNYRMETTVARWPSKQSSALKVSLHPYGKEMEKTENPRFPARNLHHNHQGYPLHVSAALILWLICVINNQLSNVIVRL